MQKNTHKIMVKFLTQNSLLQTIKQKTQQTKQTLWVCSPQLATGVHRVFSQETQKNPPSDIRFLFQLNESAVKQNQTSPYEIQYLSEHLENCEIRFLDTLQANIYVFDDSAIITSANLTESSFENGSVAGVILEGEEAAETKIFFDQNLWKNAAPKNLANLKKIKKTWNLTQKTSLKTAPLKKNKPSIQLFSDWTDDYTSKWYIGVLFPVPSKVERKIKDETGWPSDLYVAADVGYNAFRQLKLGDLTYIANLYKRSRTIEIQLAQVFDKAKVETDSGDLHLACKIIKSYQLQRIAFNELLKNTNIHSRACETLLSGEQLIHVADALAAIKQKRKKTQPNKKVSSERKKQKRKRKVYPNKP